MQTVAAGQTTAAARTIADARAAIGAVIGALLLAASAAWATGAPPQEPEPEHAFVAVASERGDGYVGEAIRVRVRVGFDAAFLAEQAIQPFRRALDVPAQVEAPWLDELAGARLVEPESQDQGGATIALNDRVATARELEPQLRDSASFRVFELERTFVPLAPGELRFAAPTLRYAFATDFEDDLVAGRAPLDRRDETRTGEPLTLPVRALPDGAPAEFTGAVGRYVAQASAEPLEVDVGDSIRLTLRLERAAGTAGDLFGFGAPELPELDGLGSRGHLESRANGARVLVFDLVARAPGERSIPALRIPFFDPEREAWDAARTEPIALHVRGESAPSGASPDGGEPADQAGDDDGLPVGVLVGVAAGVLLLAGIGLGRALSRSAA